MRNEADTNRVLDLYADMIQRICFLYMKNEAEAEDVFQDIFVKYLLYDGVFDNPEHEKAWMIRVAINACKDQLRKNKKRLWIPLEDVPHEVEGEQSSDHSSLLWAVCQLPEKYKQVIYLHYFENYSAVEIAKLLEKSENTIYTWLARARKQLKKQLGGAWHE